MEKMQLIENEGATYRGYFRQYPLQIWSVKNQAWEKYTGSVPKKFEWGTFVSEAEAEGYMRA